MRIRAQTASAWLVALSLTAAAARAAAPVGLPPPDTQPALARTPPPVTATAAHADVTGELRVVGVLADGDIAPLAPHPPDGPFATRNRVLEISVDCDDERVGGEGTMVVDCDFENDRADAAGACRVTATWGNAGGSWRSVGSGTVTASDRVHDMRHIALGEGGYEGLMLTFRATGADPQRLVGQLDPVYTADEILENRATRPWIAAYHWTVTDSEWAGLSGQASSTFGGRCTRPAPWLVHGAIDGLSTHAGRISGTTSHCDHGMTFDEGRFTIVTGDGSSLTGVFTDGYGGIDATTAEGWWTDNWTITGGTGLFEGATGSGFEDAAFRPWDAWPDGPQCAHIWMQGTVTYHPDHVVTPGP